MKKKLVFTWHCTIMFNHRLGCIYILDHVNDRVVSIMNETNQLHLASTRLHFHYVEVNAVMS